jgi:hypothetical protein
VGDWPWPSCFPTNIGPWSFSPYLFSRNKDPVGASPHGSYLGLCLNILSSEGVFFFVCWHSVDPGGGTKLVTMRSRGTMQRPVILCPCPVCAQALWIYQNSVRSLPTAKLLWHDMVSARGLASAV